MTMAGLVAALAIGLGSIESDFPEAHVVRTAAGVSQVLGISIPSSPGETTVQAAEAFLRRYEGDFALAGQDLIPETEGSRVRFSRRLGGLPIVNCDIVVGFDPQRNLVIVNAGTVPGPIAGRFALRSRSAIARARASVPGEVGTRPTATRVWYPVGVETRAAWRVELTTSRPSGSWRVYVDARSGDVLFQEGLRVDTLDRGTARHGLP